MIGKKNIVFGFIFLACTASLGFLMIEMYKDYGSATAEKQSSIGRLQTLKTDNYEEELEPIGSAEHAKANTAGILSLNKLNNIESEIDSIKGGPHAHGNLEAILCIVAGLSLCFIAAANWLKQIISFFFIIGLTMHSGMMFLSRGFDVAWAGEGLNTAIGPFFLLFGLVLLAVTAAFSLKTKVVEDSPFDSPRLSYWLLIMFFISVSYIVLFPLIPVIAYIISLIASGSVSAPVLDIAFLSILIANISGILLLLRKDRWGLEIVVASTILAILIMLLYEFSTTYIIVYGASTVMLYLILRQISKGKIWSF